MEQRDRNRVTKALLAAPLLLAAGHAAAGAQGNPQQQQEAREVRQTTVNEPLRMPPGYHLSWSDEFDRPGLPDPAKWKYDTEFNRKGWPGGVKSYYPAGRIENSRVAGGMLVITARHERLEGAPDYGGQDYTSARIMTRQQWTNGFMEIRARLSCGNGQSSEIWLLGADTKNPWPGRGEIDIAEQVGYAPGHVHEVVHTRFNDTAHAQRNGLTTVPNTCGQFHRYQMDWNQERILLGVDDHAYAKYVNDGQGPDHWPFDKPQFLILNIAVGGWGAKGGVIDPGTFPATMAIDYVRMYQPR